MNCCRKIEDIRLDSVKGLRSLSKMLTCSKINWGRTRPQKTIFMPNYLLSIDKKAIVLATYTLRVTVTDWDFRPRNVLHTTRLAKSSAGIPVASLRQLTDIEWNYRVHLRHLATSLHIRYFNQLRFSIDIELEDSRLLFLLALDFNPKAQSRCILWVCHLTGTGLRSFLLLIVVGLIRQALLLDNQISHT